MLIKLKTSCFNRSLSHNERVSYRSKLWLLLLVIPAGCITGPTPPPPDVDLRPQQRIVQTPPPGFGKPTPAPEHPHTNPPAISPPNFSPEPHFARPAQPMDRYPSAETWVGLEPWCHANGFGTPRRTATADGVWYSFFGTNGTFIVRIGSQMASWRGVEVRLGFAPQMSGGHPFIHTLDIRKNVLPLMENPFPPRPPRVIVLDPGHGGTDPGTKNVATGHFEKEYTLDWARRIQSILSANGCTVILTRTSDMTLDHSNRVLIADHHHADVFLSLHFNSEPLPQHDEMGLETFCLTPRGMPSNETRGNPDNTTASFPGNAFDVENVRLAFRLHRALLKINGHADRGVCRMRFPTVLQLQNRPAALIEGGFMSNPDEARRIANPKYRQRLAEMVAEVLLEDSENPTPSVGVTNSETKRRPAPETRHE